MVVENIEPTEDMLMEQVISDGLQFVKSLTDYYGPDKGMAVWNTLGESVGKSLHNKIFMAMLTGKPFMTVTFNAGPATNAGNAVPVIKCIRQYTGTGLKEAKDYWDASKITSQTIKVLNPATAREFRDELRRLGCIVY